MSMSQVGSGLPRLLAERYELSEQLASGGMTSVWRGHDRVLGRDVVVKVLHPELSANEGFRARFHEEAVNAARLTHPSIVALYDTGEQEGVAYIVMELVNGPSLGQVLARNGPLPPARAARLAIEVCAALDYAHEAGVCHGSLKAGNILLADDGTVKVADFSIARAAADDDPGRTGEILTSDGFLAPEVARGEQADGRADVYGLGACLYAMLTGRPPGADPATVMPPRSLRAGVPRELDAVVRQAMAPDPDDRFQTAQAMAAVMYRSATHADGPPAGELVGLPAELPTQRELPLPPSRGFLRHEGRWLGWTLALVVLAGALVVLGVRLAGDDLAGLLGGDQPRGTTDTPSTTAGSRTVRVSGARSYDPPRGDGKENDEFTRNAIDGQAGTSWTTEGYKSPNLGGLKPGVGLVLDLGSAKRARQLVLTLTGAGADFTLYAADGDVPPSIDNGWQQVAGEQDAAQEVTVDLPGDPHQFYLVWFTDLPRDDGKFRAGIVEARFKS
jgi:hypothetical protein